MRLLTALVFLCMFPGHAAAEILLGVTTSRGSADEPRWRALEPYFSAALNTPVKVVGFPPNRIGKELSFGRLSFALVNPLTAVEVIHHGKARPIANLKTNGAVYFAGAIIVRSDSPVLSLAGLPGKDVLAYQASSAGGYVFQLYHLLQNGIPRQSLQSLRHNDSQEQIALAVEAGKIDVGFVRSGMLEALAAEGRINLARLRVLDERKDELRQKHTTDLYPEWVLLASPQVQTETVDNFRRAALAIRPDLTAAQAAKIDGFVEPLSLDGVREAMKALRIAPFDAMP